MRRTAGRKAARDDEASGRDERQQPQQAARTKAGGTADAHRRRQAARARADGAEIAGDPADRRPAARVAVQHPGPRLRRSGRRARACSTCSPAPARSASRRCRAAQPSCCSSMTAPRRARCCAAMSMRWARAARARSIAATPRSSASSARCSRSRWLSSIRLMARVWPSGRCSRRVDGGWLTPGSLAVVEEAADVEIRGAGGLRGDRAARLRRDASIIFLRAR